jgi:hypothetical protein
VRVWNPVDKKLELTKEFEEEPLSLSVHPSGVYLAVAFPDRIKILSLLLDDIALVREIPARSVSPLSPPPFPFSLLSPFSPFLLGMTWLGQLCEVLEGRPVLGICERCEHADLQSDERRSRLHVARPQQSHQVRCVDELRLAHDDRRGRGSGLLLVRFHPPFSPSDPSPLTVLFLGSCFLTTACTEGMSTTQEVFLSLRERVRPMERGRTSRRGIGLGTLDG